MHYWTIHEIPDEIIEGSEVHRLLERFPLARRAGGNFIFVSCLEDAVDPIIFDPGQAPTEYTTEARPPEEQDPVAELAGLLLAEDRSKAIWISKGDCVALDKSERWKSWCEDYDART